MRADLAAVARSLAAMAGWIAQYRDTLSFSYKHNIWQYTGSGSVKGISKPVDMNIG